MGNAQANRLPENSVPLRTAEAEAVQLRPAERDDVKLGVEPVRVIKIYPDPYSGPTEVTPSAEDQYLETTHKTLAQRIHIKPIPNNYGLITYNGNIITVS